MTLTEELRDALDANGIEYECGLTTRGGGWVSQDTVTVAYPVTGDPISAISFEEEDDKFMCLDPLTISQCIAAVMG